MSTHPIQYNAPAFRALAADPQLDVHVFYGWEGPATSIDHEFGRAIAWDIPLLDNYAYTFVANVSADPGTHHLRGIDNPSIVSQIAQWRPDVILVYGWSFLSHLKTLRAFHGSIPILFRGDSTLLDERRGLRTLARRKWLRWVYSHIDIALYTGQTNRQYFEAHGMLPEQLRWAPHAVDNGRFSADSEARAAEAREWRRQLGIADEQTVFLFAGKFSRRKDPEILLSAFIAAKNAIPGSGAHLVFVGDGELAASLHGRVSGRTDVHFLGFQNQSVMPVIYRLGNVTILPSRYGETWGLAVNESMACGRPAIVSDRVGCAPDLVHDGQTGLIFEHANEKSLCGAIRTVLLYRDRLGAMGDSAREMIDRWSIEAYASSVASAVVSSTARSSSG